MYSLKHLIRTLGLTLVLAAMTACGGGGGESTPVVVQPVSSQPTQSNVLPLAVDSGPVGNGVNRLFASVTVCQPGNATLCQTIDHILVDTGSAGLRLLSSALTPALRLPTSSGAAGFPLLNCVQFIDNTYGWGPVALGDLVIGGKTASSVPIQVIADPAYKALDSVCSSAGTATEINNTDTLGANGVLGIGLFKEDCGTACATNPANGYYFTCTSSGCTATVGTTASTRQQVQNPVPLFAADNNGFLIDLPAVGASGADILSGSLIFGVGTKSNNQLGAGKVLTTNSSGYISTLLLGRTLSNSFIDSGSNGLYFDNSTLASCSVQSGAWGYYCPATSTAFSAILTGANAVSSPVTFSVSNALTLFNNPTLSVLPTLAGPIGDRRTFDWGLPFFYGRRVFFGIEGLTSTGGTGPFYAF